MINLPRLLAPTTWGEYYGHKMDKHVILRSIVEDAELFPNSFYVSGETGTGKTTLVNLIIRSLICEAPKDYTLEGIIYPRVDPCGKCPTCTAIKDFREANSVYTNIKLVQNGKGDEEKINASVDDALRLSMTPPLDFASTRKDYRFIIFDEWQDFDKKQHQKVLLRAEDALDTSIFVFITMADDEIKERRRTALVSRGIGIDLRGFTDKEIVDYLLNVVNPSLPSGSPKLKEPEAAAIAKQSANSLRMALAHYGKLYRYDAGLDYIRPETARYFLGYTDPEDRLELWRALNSNNWRTYDECLDRISRVYNPSKLDRLALDLVEDVSKAIRNGKGKHEDQMLAIQVLFKYVANYKTYRLSDYLLVLKGLNLGVV